MKSFREFIAYLLQRIEYRRYVALMGALIFVNSIVCSYLYALLIGEHDVSDNVKPELSYIVLFAFFCAKWVSSFIKSLLATEKMKVTESITEVGTRYLITTVVNIRPYIMKTEDITKMLYKIDNKIYSMVSLMFMTTDTIVGIMSNVTGIIMIFGISLKALILIVCTNLAVYILYYNKRMYDIVKLDKQTQNTNADKYKHLHTLTSGLYDHVIHNEKKYVIDEFTRLRIEIEKSYHSTMGMSGYITFVVESVNFGIIALSLWMVLAETMNIAVIIMYMFQTKSTIDALIAYSVSYANASVRFDSVVEYIALVTNNQAIDYVQQFWTSRLSFDNIMYTATSKNRKPFTLNVRGNHEHKLGDVVYVKGPSGSGKTTLIELLSGIYDVATFSGNVFVDGDRCVDGFQNITSSRTVVVQDSDKYVDFSGSLYNIITGSITVCADNEEIVRTLLSMVNLHQVLDSLKQNIHAELSDKLSGGQKMKLCLAKSLYRIFRSKSLIVIFDEPDKGLPQSETIEILQRIINRLSSTSIIFLITHSPDVEQHLVFTHVLKVTSGEVC